MTSEQVMHTITVLLAVAACIGPMFFGYMVYKMATVFVTKGEFDTYKARADEDRLEIKRKLDAMDAKFDRMYDKIGEAMKRGSSHHSD